MQLVYSYLEKINLDKFLVFGIYSNNKHSEKKFNRSKLAILPDQVKK